jgi:hypothetical protein
MTINIDYLLEYIQYGSATINHRMYNKYTKLDVKYIKIRLENKKKDLDYIKSIIDEVNSKFRSAQTLLLNYQECILSVVVNKHKKYIGIKYYKRDVSDIYYYFEVSTKNGTYDEITNWFKNIARTTPFFSFIKPKILYKGDTPEYFTYITTLYDKLNKLLNHFHGRSSNSQSIPKYSIIDLIVMDENTSDNYNLSLIMTDKYNFSETNERPYYFEKIVCDENRGICYTYTHKGENLFYLGIIKYKYHISETRKYDMISFVYHTDINIFKDILIHYKFIYKYLKENRKSFHNEELDELIGICKYSLINKEYLLIKGEIKKYLDMDDEQYNEFIEILNKYNAYILGGFILSKILKNTKTVNDDLFICIRYLLIDSFIKELLLCNFSVRIVKLIKISGLLEYEQIYCYIECFINGKKIYIVVLCETCTYKGFFNTKLDYYYLNTSFIRPKNDNNEIKLIIDKNKNTTSFDVIIQQYNSFVSKIDEDLIMINDNLIYKILIKYLISNTIIINEYIQDNDKYKKIIDVFISEYTDNYELYGGDGISIYISILQDKFEIPINKIYNIILNIVLNFHIEEKNDERGIIFISFIMNFMKNYIKLNNEIINLIISYIEFMRTYNIVKPFEESPVLINLNLAEDVIYTNENTDGICVNMTNIEEEDTTITTYLSNHDNLLFILPGNIFTCTTKSDLITWITAVNDEHNKYRIFFHSINAIEKDYYVRIATHTGHFYMLCSYIYIILLSNSGVFQFVEVPNANIKLSGPNGAVYGSINILKCSRVENYNEIILSKIKPIL